MILNKELVFDCKNESVAQGLKECFSIDLISQILSAYLYGFNVFEVNYRQKMAFIFRA